MLVSVAALPPPGFASPLPETARSSSALTPSVLLEDPANLFLFPQLAPAQSSVLMAFGASGTSAPRAGANASLGGHSLFYLFQRGSLPRIYETHELAERPISRVGWGAQLGEYRLGFSYAWAMSGMKDDRLRRFETGDVQWEREELSVFQTAHYWNATLGIGWQRGRTSCDLALGLMQEDVESERTELNEFAHLFEARKYTIEANLRAHSGIHPVLALRLALPLGEDTLLRTYGFFWDQGFETTVDWYGRAWANDFLYEEERREYHDEDNGREWSGGISVEGRAKWGIRWMVHGLWEDERSPFLYEPRNITWSVWERQQWQERTGRCGAALRIPFYGWCEILAGAVVRYEWVTETTEQFHSGSLTESWSNSDESASYAFAWGVGRDFGLLELTASVARTLTPGDPFALLDIGIRF